MNKIFAVWCKVELTKKPAWLDDFRLKYDLPYEYHVTLKQPCYIEENDFKKVKLIMDNLFIKYLKTKNITLNFTKLELDSDLDDSFIYILSEKNQELERIQKIIVKELKDYSEYEQTKNREYEENFRPHITIARKLDNVRFKQAQSELKNDYMCTGIIKEVILSCVKEVSIKESMDPKNRVVYKLERNED